MCGRYTLTRHDSAVDDLQATLGASAAGEWWKARYNIAPTQPAPVVIGAERRVELLRWGLVPFWAGSDPRRAPLMINARVESLPHKQWFREALAERRCLVVADGFFEWVRDDPKHPQPIYFHHQPRTTIVFAGLWARAHTKAGEQLSFTIITGPARPLVAAVHDRMPIVLPAEAYSAWLSPATTSEAARALLDEPASLAAWVGEPVSTRVNKALNDDPECIAPPEPAQRSLF